MSAMQKIRVNSCNDKCCCWILKSHNDNVQMKFKHTMSNDNDYCNLALWDVSHGVISTKWAKSWHKKSIINKCRGGIDEHNKDIWNVKHQCKEHTINKPMQHIEIIRRWKRTREINNVVIVSKGN